MSRKLRAILPIESNTAAPSPLRETVLCHAASSGSRAFIACQNRCARIDSALHLKMKAGIHPEYYETDMVCACDAAYHTRCTRRDIKICICAACHPFITVEQKFVDTAERVEKFERR